MPTVTLNKEVFERLVGKKLPLEQLKDRISMLGTDLEKIEGNEIHVEVFPNRPDMLSEQGFARAFSSFIGVKKGLREYLLKKSGEKVIVDKNIKNIRPYTVCAIAKNLKLNDEKIRELIQIQEKLHTTFCRDRKKAAIGIYPLETIKMPIYFKAMKPGDIKFRPLEYPTEITGQQILSKHPAGRKYAYLLEGLSMYPVFIDSNNEILSLPPLINSHKTGKITEKTEEVFIELSGFDLGYQIIGLNILAATLIDMGAEMYSMEVVYPDKTISTPDLAPAKMKLDIKEVNKLLGIELKEKDIKNYLEQMGYGYDKGTALVPAYRADVLHPWDLIEDIAIAYGYEKFKEEIPKVATIGHEDKEEVFIRKIANILAGLGLLEVSNYHLGSSEEFNNKMNVKIKLVELENAMNSDSSVLRSWMLPCLLKVLSKNKHHEYPQNIFEIGTVFKKDSSTETGVYEFKRLAVACSNIVADYTYAKQILDYLLSLLDLESSIEPVEHDSFIKGRVGRVSVNGKEVAYIGELHPSVLNNWQLENPVVGFELNLTDLQSVMK